MEYSCNAPVVFFDSLKSFCNLPEAIVRKIIFFKHPICVHLTMTLTSTQTEPIILVWSGDISKNIDSSAVEIPNSIAEFSGIRNHVDTHPNENFSIKIHSCAIEAIEVRLMDNEEYDWQLTSNLAHVAEREILKQHSVVYTNQKMKFYITPTLSVTLLVTSIITNKSLVERGSHGDTNTCQQSNPEGNNPSNTEELQIPSQNLFNQAVTNFLSFFDDKNETNSNVMTSVPGLQSVENNINQPNIIVAKLTTRTKVIVIPKDRQSNNNADHSYINNFQNISNSDHSSESVVDNQILTSKLYEQQFRYISTSSIFACPLFVLPHRYRDHNTGFFSPRHASEISTVSGRSDDSENILSLFLTAQESNSNSISNNSKLFQERDGIHQYQYQPPPNQHTQEESICFVHPIYFHRIEEILSLSHPITYPSCHPPSTSTSSFPYTTSSSFLILLEKISVKKSEVVRPLADTLVLRLFFSTQIRPDFISLPYSARKSLNITDFDLIRIKLFHEKDIPIIRPQSILFHPIQWKVVNDIQDNSNNSNNNKKKSSELNIFSDTSNNNNNSNSMSDNNNNNKKKKSTNEVNPNDDSFFSLALRRYFENQRRFTNRTIVSHGMVIPLLLLPESLASEQLRNMKKGESRREKAAAITSSSTTTTTTSSLRNLSSKSSITKFIKVDYQVNLCYDHNPTITTTTTSSTSIMKANGVKVSDNTTSSVKDTGHPPFYCIELQNVHNRDEGRDTTSQDKLLPFLQDCRMGTEKNVAISTSCNLHCQSMKRFLLNTTTDPFLSSSYMGEREGGGTMVPVGQEKIFSTILKEILPILWPTAVLDRLRHGIAPGAGAVLIGGSGTGKSSLLRSIRFLFEDSPQTVGCVETIQCSMLRGKSMAEVLQTFTTVFESARSKPVSLLLLDDIDTLCPASSDEPGSELASTQAELIAKHISDLMSSTYSKMLKNHQVAISLYDILNPDHKSDCRNNSNNTSSDNSSYSTHAHHSLPYIYERMTAQSLHGAMFILATAQTPLIQPCLLSLHGLRRVWNIPALKSIDRIRIIKSTLVHLGAEGTSINSWMKDDDDAIGRVTEGFRVGDLLTISKKVLATRISQSLSTSSSSSFSSSSTSPEIEKERKLHNISVSASDVLTSIPDFIPLASAGDSSGSNGGSKSEPLSSDWSTVGGLKTIQKELKNILRRPLLFRRLYNNCPVKLPRGILLYGPPGCGKTMIAAAAGKECGMACISIRGPQLLNKYVGASERAMRDLFERAKSSGRPCLLFFDEFEALAPKRGRDNSGVTDRVVNQLLTFLDGVEDTMGGQAGDGEGQVFVLAATSRPDMVDVALLRPGRIEKHLYIGLPNRRQRLDILRLSLKPLCCHHDVSQAIAEISDDCHSEGLTGADLRGLVNSAFLLAAHAYIDNLTSKHHENGNQFPESPITLGGHESSPVAAASIIMQSYGDSTAIVTASNLWEALATTRPSISPQDQLFYAEIHGRFRQSSEQEGNSFPAADSGEDVLKQRTALM